VQIEDMAGTKRALTQVDGNASRTEPAKKRATTSVAPSDKENALPDYAKMKKDELRALLERCGIRSSARTKQVLIMTLEDNESTVREKLNIQDGPEEAALPTDNLTLDLEWWTLCRPLEDIKQERRAAEEDYDSEKDYAEVDEDEAQDPRETQIEDATHGKIQAKSICGQKNCICKLPIEDHPEHKWMLTKKGYLNTARLMYEVNIRDQDAIGEYFCNDFSGYGYQEVMENQVRLFVTEMGDSLIFVLS
jgi:hypothetical protein